MNMIKRRFWVLSILLAVVFTVVISFAFSPVRSVMADGEEKESVAVDETDIKAKIDRWLDENRELLKSEEKNRSNDTIDYSSFEHITDGTVTNLSGKIIVVSSSSKYYDNKHLDVDDINSTYNLEFSFTENYFLIYENSLSQEPFVIDVLGENAVSSLGLEGDYYCYYIPDILSNFSDSSCTLNFDELTFNLDVSTLALDEVYFYESSSVEPATPHGSNTASSISDGFGDFDFSDISSVWEDSDVVTKVISVVALCGLVVLVFSIPSLLRKRKR